MEKYGTRMSVLRGRKQWKIVSQQLHSRDMPPRKKKVAQPTDAERKLMYRWIDETVDFLDCSGPKDPGRVTLHRLNRQEYNNTNKTANPATMARITLLCTERAASRSIETQTSTRLPRAKLIKSVAGEMLDVRLSHPCTGRKITKIASISRTKGTKSRNNRSTRCGEI